MIDFRVIRCRTFFIGLLLIFATLAVYWPARHYDFVNYDDDNYVYENQNIYPGLTWQGFDCAWMEPVAGNWHPLTMLSHMVDCQFFGLDAGPPHLVNVAFHCANAVLLLLLLEAATGAFWRSAFVAALFALHPMRVESVAWISERKDVLSGFFFMLTLWMYVLYAKEKNSAPPGGSKKRCQRFYRLSLAFFIMGLLSKPMLVTLPFVLLFLDFWPLKRIMDAGPPVFKLSALKPLLLEKWPFFLFSFILCPITLLTQRTAMSVHSESVFFRAERIVLNYFDYVEKLLWPHNLSFLYTRPEIIPLASFLTAAVALISISALCVVGWRRCPYLAMGWLWFLTMLLPVSGVVLLGALSIADRYTYLPGIGFYLMITWAVADFGQKILSARPRKLLATAGAAVILSLCAVLSRQQLTCWQNSQTLMEHALKIDPDNHVAQVDLHIYLFEKEHPGVRGHPANSTGSNPEK